MFTGINKEEVVETKRDKLCRMFDLNLIDIDGYKSYAGIGSRKAPKWVLDLMKSTAEKLAIYGLVLRSGGATGSDLAFESGHRKVNDNCEIFTIDNYKTMTKDYVKSKLIASYFHPNWSSLSNMSMNLMGRNTNQILGKDLNNVVSFVLCYTELGKLTGGTSQAIRIATYIGVPVFNFGLYENKQQCEKALNLFLKEVLE